MEIILLNGFPLKHLKKLHHDLTELENFLQINFGGYSQVKDEIQDIYFVQEIIESLVKSEKYRVIEEEKKANIESLNLDF